MKELVIISGKGGTGKTSIVSAFASLAENAVLCDADVDAADLHLVLAPETSERHDFKSGHTAEIDINRCTRCGICSDMCRWDAIQNFVVSAVACEGCGVCYHFCPEKAVKFPENICGDWFKSSTRFGPMVHARLGIAEENSGKLVSLVRQEARKVAELKEKSLILTDGPPGIGCPVIAAIGNSDLVLIVTEPTVSGKHDMTRVIELAAHFNVQALLCINKYDLNAAISSDIEEFAASKGVPCVGKIPFAPVFTEAMVNAQTVFEYVKADAAEDHPVLKRLTAVWAKVIAKMMT